MIGVVAGWVWRGLKKTQMPAPVGLALTGFIGSMTNTVFVMGSIFLLFAQQYAEVKDVGREAVFGLIMATVTGAGIPEAIAAAVLVSAISLAIMKAGVLRVSPA
jgi:uncharacterized membrane protein